MAKKEHNHHHPVPPPLPAQDSGDDLATIPADSPWQIVPDQRGGPQVDRARPSREPAHEEIPATSPSLSPLVRHKYTVATVGVILASLLILAIVVVLLFGGFSEADPGDAPPRVSVALVNPRVVPDAPADEAYLEKKNAVLQIFEEISGIPDQPLVPGQHQSIQTLGTRLMTSDTPFAEAVLAALPGGVPRAEEAFVDYHQTWQLGLIVLDEATKVLDEMMAMGAELKDVTVSDTSKAMKAWLIEWLLGKQGLYCEVRTQYWRQVKTKRPPPGPNGKEDIAKLRQERREFAEAFEYPQTALHAYCGAE